MYQTFNNWQCFIEEHWFCYSNQWCRAFRSPVESWQIRFSKQMNTFAWLKARLFISVAKLNNKPVQPFGDWNQGVCWNRTSTAIWVIHKRRPQSTTFTIKFLFSSTRGSTFYNKVLCLDSGLLHSKKFIHQTPSPHPRLCIIRSLVMWSQRAGFIAAAGHIQ